jgi:hypothetical protein
MPITDRLTIFVRVGFPFLEKNITYLLVLVISYVLSDELFNPGQYFTTSLVYIINLGGPTARGQLKTVQGIIVILTNSLL